MMTPEALLARLPESLPRYTSYPPANHFKPGEAKALLPQLLQAIGSAKALSLYIHIPFCDRLCWFCGCHTKHTLRYDPIQAYVRVLVQEIALWRRQFSAKPNVSRLHFGGGSPSLLTNEDLTLIRTALNEAFTFLPDAEISFEIDPSDMKERNIDGLAAFGMTRASIGVQDFDPLVQQAINRPQTFEDTARVVAMLRKAGVTSLNIDALYGLPLQTPFRLRNTLDQVLSLKPDRIALFGYAHVPWLKAHQKLIKDQDLPDTLQRLKDSTWASEHISAMLAIRSSASTTSPLLHDSLAVAARSGHLRRNFQGYTDDAADVMLPLGASSIGGFAGGFVQNEPATGVYTAKVTAGELPLSRGLARTSEDQIRGWIIERLMCDYGFEYNALRKTFGPDSEAHIRFAKALAAREPDGLCTTSDTAFTVPDTMRSLIRVVASRFDQWLTVAPKQYSKAV